MADVYFYQENNGEEIVIEDGTGLGDSESVTHPDDLLPPVQRLSKYAHSEHVYNRQIVARTVLETLRTVADVEENVHIVLQVMNLLSYDPDPGVRAELMEQVPHIAMFCQEVKTKLDHIVPNHLLPMMVKYLTDSIDQVRKNSQAAILVLLEQGLVERGHVEEQVCPVITRLTEPDSSDEYRNEAVALLSKISPLIGKETVEKLFLDRFSTLCLDPLAQVRKVCASSFGEFATVVGSDATENVLLPKFFYLCEDGVWGVRKHCAEVFMSVSCVCSPSTRQSELSPIFINLLRDQSRWVRMAAFQTLGPFISTFADPSLTSLLHNDNGEIVVTDHEKLAQKLSELEEERAVEMSKKHDEKKAVPGDESDVMETECDTRGEVGKLVFSHETKSPEELRASSFVVKSPKSDNGAAVVEEQTFNDFFYWRDPPRLIDATKFPPSSTLSSSVLEESQDQLSKLALKPSENEDSTKSLCSSGGSGSQDSEDSSQELIRSASAESHASNRTSAMDLKAYDSQRYSEESTIQEFPIDPALPKGPPATEQDIVPQLLIDHYVSMINPSRAQTVDSDITRHCAFSLPAVALTLGRANWPLLRDTYGSLATDMQWKVRRTLASSIHELGIILGKEAAGTDLIPIFNGFLKDLDEVRIGLLKHLADFLMLLKPEDREDYLPKLSEFRKMDNERNWRFRQELVVQLEKLIPCFSPHAVWEWLSPLALAMVLDKVASVRQGAVVVIASIIKSLSESDHPDLASNVLDNVIDLLSHDSFWVYRQAFVCVCLQIYRTKAIDRATYRCKLLPLLLDLSEDRVPNVRLAVSRTLSTVLQDDPSFFDQEKPNSDEMVNVERLHTVEKNLKNDSDVDVRFFFGGAAKYFFDEQNREESDEDDRQDVGTSSH